MEAGGGRKSKDNAEAQTGQRICREQEVAEARLLTTSLWDVTTDVNGLSIVYFDAIRSGCEKWGKKGRGGWRVVSRTRRKTHPYTNRAGGVRPPAMLCVVESWGFGLRKRGRFLSGRAGPRRLATMEVPARKPRYVWSLQNVTPLFLSWLRWSCSHFKPEFGADRSSTIIQKLRNKILRASIRHRRYRALPGSACCWRPAHS